MQCYEYLAMHRYARRHLGDWTEQYDDLELAEVLDEHDVQNLADVKRIGANHSRASVTAAR